MQMVKKVGTLVKAGTFVAAALMLLCALSSCATPENEGGGDASAFTIGNFAVIPGSGQIEVTLNGAKASFNPATAEKLSNYTIYDNDGNPVQITSVTLSSDNKKIIIALKASAANGAASAPEAGVWSVNMDKVVFADKKAPEADKDYKCVVTAVQHDITINVGPISDEENTVTLKIVNGIGVFARGVQLKNYDVTLGGRPVTGKLVTVGDGSQTSPEAVVNFENKGSGDLTVTLKPDAFDSVAVVTTSDIRATVSTSAPNILPLTNPVNFSPYGTEDIKGGGSAPGGVTITVPNNTTEVKFTPGLSANQQIYPSSTSIDLAAVGYSFFLKLFTVDTGDIARWGGNKKFTLIITEVEHTSREYGVTVIVLDGDGGGDISNLTDPVSGFTISSAIPSGGANTAVITGTGPNFGVNLNLATGTTQAVVATNFANGNQSTQATTQPFTGGGWSATISAGGIITVELNDNYLGGASFPVVVKETGKNSRTYTFNVTSSAV
jgi:hypothetical protein